MNGAIGAALYRSLSQLNLVIYAKLSLVAALTSGSGSVRKPCPLGIVPIPSLTQVAQMLENIGGDAVQFTDAELAELNQYASAIEVQGARLPGGILVRVRSTSERISKESERCQLAETARNHRFPPVSASHKRYTQ
jgi:hypothetical protein